MLSSIATTERGQQCVFRVGYHSELSSIFHVIIFYHQTEPKWADLSQECWKDKAFPESSLIMVKFSQLLLKLTYLRVEFRPWKRKMKLENFHP